jgi:acyl dehydratase
MNQATKTSKVNALKGALIGKLEAASHTRAGRDSAHRPEMAVARVTKGGCPLRIAVVPTTVTHVRDLADQVGNFLGHSAWHEITQRQVNLFAEATWDDQWIHTDPERAAAGPYGGTIAHGFLTMSLTPTLLAEIWRVDGIDMTVNQGLDNLRLRAPVPVGAQVRMGADLLSARTRPKGFHEVVVRLTFESEHAGRRQRAATADLTILLREVAAVPR